MLSKVTNRVRPRRPSLQFETSTSPPEPKPERLHEAPALLRWSSFSDPFPSVALGGYTRYYSKIQPDFTHSFSKSPMFCPILSHYPERSPSRETPATSPLFSLTPPPKQRSLTVIHEVSIESISAKKPRNLSVTISTSPSASTSKSATSLTRSPTSLRRRRRQLLRTPSIERDFGINSRHLFGSRSLSVSANHNSDDSSSMDANTPLSISLSLSTSTSTSMSTSVSHGYSRSSDSHSSQSDSSHSHQSEYPITPSTSVDSGEEGDVFAGTYLEKGWIQRALEPESESELVGVLRRPDSRTSFSTAKSDFGDEEGGGEV
ncbi:hypothetical protein GALMADRAFT_139223 [Galerina marginata CBS 339.88]|uniref:Uncharacterized protein n=1 Tax=Galerina marginata (strain CBS 339.88) TaxID=685588 RepID=A0A067T242_GALM3|nr:hypothetical protein GALMADRAFT_139223 [Galerina marginata CBS 339.88]